MYHSSKRGNCHNKNGILCYLYRFSWYSAGKCVNERATGHALFSQNAVSRSEILVGFN